MALTNKPLDRLLVRRTKPGDRLSAAEQNAIKDELRRARITVDGAAVDGRGGTRLIPRSRREVRPAQAPAGGIPAKVGNTPGQAVCTLFTWDGASHVLGTDTLTVLNDYPGPVGNNKLIKIYWWSGAWWMGMESCT